MKAKINTIEDENYYRIYANGDFKLNVSKKANKLENVVQWLKDSGYKEVEVIENNKDESG